MSSWDQLPKRHSSSGGSIPGFEKGEQVLYKIAMDYPTADPLFDVMLHT